MSHISRLVQEVTLHIYRMNPQELIRCAILAALLFCTLYRSWDNKPWRRPVIGLALAVWFGVVMWMTVLGREGGGVYDVNWIPLHTYRAVTPGQFPEAILSGLMNVALFYPAGLLLGALLPEKWSFRRGMLCTVLLFALFGLSIELSQYFFRLGVSEIDDVLHNTLGAGFGFAAFRAFVNNINP